MSTAVNTNVREAKLPAAKIGANQTATARRRTWALG
jgi:hypothetical protein